MKKKTNTKVYILIFGLLVLMTFVFAFLFRGLTDNRAYEKYLSAAQLCIEQEDYDNALSALRKASKKSSTEECMLLMVQCYEAQGNYEKALEVLREMDTSDSSISSRIAADEARRKNSASSGQVVIAGTSYDGSASSLVLDGQNLDSSVLEQVIQLYALSNLSLSDNNISDISALSSLGGLTTLNLNNNNISDISALAALTNLRTLYLDGNPITDFSPLYGLSNLSFISINGIQIKESALKELSNSLPNCAINGADTSADVKLIALGGVTFSVDISDPLDLSNRGITDISALSQCSNLTYINLSGNSISDISPLMEIQYLSHLDISGNSVSDLRPLMGLSSLKYLDASGNLVSSTVSLGANSSLTELYLGNNPITDFSGIRKLKNLTSLGLADTGLSSSDISYFTLLSKLISLDITGDSGISGEAYEQLQALIPKCEISHSPLVYTFSFSGSSIPSDTTALDLPGRGISDLSALLNFSCLESVNLSNNNISNLYYFDICPSKYTIKYLNLSDNDIIDLSGIGSMTNLETLVLTNNSIYSVSPLYSLDNLRLLYISGNPISAEQLTELNSYLPNCQIITE